jgi:hypothetical protein
MMTLFEKRFSSKSTFRLISAVIYILAIFVLPLTHTCISTESERSYCHLGVSELYGDVGVDVTGHDEDGSGQDDHDGESSANGYTCTACVYSANSKTSEVGCGIILVISETSTGTKLPRTSQRLKQAEWTSSVFLRAPPLNIS